RLGRAENPSQTYATNFRDGTLAPLGNDAVSADAEELLGYGDQNVGGAVAHGRTAESPQYTAGRDAGVAAGRDVDRRVADHERPPILRRKTERPQRHVHRVGEIVLGVDERPVEIEDDVGERVHAVPRAP